MSVFSSTSPVQILNSPLNRSKSKYQYSFAKSPRFRKPYYNCEQAFYEVFKSQPTRGAGFGYGTKYDFTLNKQYAPQPTLYSIDSQFSVNKVKAKGLSFGLGRDQLKENGHIQQGPLKYPGPGQYNSRPQSRDRAFSMRPKTEVPWMPNFLKEKDESFLKPGPGHYEQVKSLRADGKQFISKYKSSVGTVINSQTKRFHTESSIIPGPGDYEQLQTLTDDGQYTLSKFKGQGKRIFGSQKRQSFIDDAVKHQKTNKLPGPGNYRQHSEFGNYENAMLIAQKLRPYTAIAGSGRQPTRDNVKRMNMTFSQL